MIVLTIISFYATYPRPNHRRNSFVKSEQSNGTSSGTICPPEIWIQKCYYQCWCTSQCGAESACCIYRLNIFNMTRHSISVISTTKIRIITMEKLVGKKDRRECDDDFSLLWKECGDVLILYFSIEASEKKSAITNMEKNLLKSWGFATDSQSHTCT